MVQWRHLCCVRWVNCRLKEPKRSCWTCEAISHRYDPQRNDEEGRWGCLTQKIHPTTMWTWLCLDIWQTITGLCTGVAFQDTFRIAPWLFAIGWQIKSFKPESKLKLTSSLVGNVIVHFCFLTFSSVSSLVRDLFQNRFLVCCVVTHLCREMGLFTGANDVPVAKIVALHSSTSLVRYTKTLFRTNSWLTLCFKLS